MRKLLYILFLLLPVLGYSQATSVSLGTSSTGTLTLSFNTWTKVDPNVTITANGNITGFRVQISQNYLSGASGDQLRSTATLPSGITVSAFNTTTGILVFNGTTSASNWETILRGVEFRSTTNTCYSLQRRVTFVAGTVFYNPLTEHFYEYVSGNITWTNSKTSAENRSYFGRAGYLSTMSSEAENNFIWRLMSSDGWFGASDELSEVNNAKGTTAFASQAAVEQKWHWVTGPEKGTQFSNGSTAVTGQYSKWAGGEPNNAGGEHYGQFYSTNSGQWNDLPNTTLPGYICEYGDMPSDITTSITILTRNIEISGASSGYISGGDINVCSGSNSTTLTLNGYTGSIVRWESSFDNFFTAGTTISSTSSSITVTNLTKTTYYRAIVNSTSPTTCSNLATSSVFLSVKPTKAGTIFAANNSICSGGLVELTLSGQQGNVNKWQRSSDNINWENITNTTTSLNETLYGLGNGLNTDGVNDYVLLPKPTLNNFTIEYWVRTTQTSLTGSQWYAGSGIVDAEVGGGTTDFGTSLLNGKLAFGLGVPDVTIQSTTSINNGQWYHVAVTWDGTTGAMRLYINGTLESSGTGPTGTRIAPPNIRIGSIQTGIQYFAGSIDELRIWNTVRTQSEIQTNMNNEVATNSALVSYYKFNQGTANSTNTGTTTLSDASGNSNNGTLYNFGLSGSSSNWTNGKGSIYYYRVEVQTPNCGSPVFSDSKIITVTSGTPPVGGSVSSVNLSSTTNSGSVTLSGHTGTIVKWQRSTNDGVTWTDLTNTTTTQSYTNITTKTLFRVQLQSGTCGFAYSSNGVVQIVYTISGTVTLPTSNTLSPTVSLSLYKVVGGTETLVETKNVNTNGTYSFNVPENGVNYKLVPSLTHQGITTNDFDLSFGEVQNVNTPNNTASGLVMTGTRQWKAADVNKNGILDLGDSYLVAAHITGLKTISEVLWFTETNYNSITKNNFGSVSPVTSFSFTSVSSSVTQNIKFCMLGDIDLSHSSN